jgi:hypothetical protein
MIGTRIPAATNRKTVIYPIRFRIFFRFFAALNEEEEKKQHILKDINDNYSSFASSIDSSFFLIVPVRD